MSKFHLRIRELRISRKLSQQELADSLKISKSSVNMYERGEREPGLDLIEAIADFFNVDLDYLMGKTDIPQKHLFNGAKSVALTFDKTQMTIGERIRDRRLRLGLSADELAEILGENKDTIYRYESNDIENLPASIIVHLAKVLNCSPAYLMGWAESENSQLECTPKEQSLIKSYRLLNATGQTKVDEYVSDLVDGGKYAENITTGKSYMLLVGKGGSADVEIKDPEGLDEEIEKLKKKHGLK